MVFILVVKPEKIVTALEIMNSVFEEFDDVAFDHGTQTFWAIKEEELIGVVHPSCASLLYQGNPLIGPKEEIAELEKSAAIINRLLPDPGQFAPYYIVPL